MAQTTEVKATLDKIFRKGSDARKVAEIMLDGKPHSRMEIAEKAGTSATQIPRVKRMIEDAGLMIETSIGSDGRSTVYRRCSDEGAKPSHADAGQVVSLFISGSTIDVETLTGQYVVTFHEDGTVGVKTPKQEITLV